MKTIIVTLAVLGLAFAGCKKKDEPKPAPVGTKPAVGTATTATGTPPAQASGTAPGDAPPGGPVDAVSVINAAFAAFNDGKLEEAAAFLAEDYEDLNAAAADTPVKGREAIIAVWQRIKASFSDLRVGTNISAGSSVHGDRHYANTVTIPKSKK